MILFLGMGDLSSGKTTGTAPGERRTATDVVKNAIRARYAPKAFKRTASCMRFRGQYFAQHETHKVSGKTCLERPERSRIEHQLPDGSVVVEVVRGAQGWRLEGGRVVRMNSEHIAESKRYGYVDWIMTLHPLLTSKVGLQRIESVEVSGRPAVGLRVMSANELDVDLFFDAETFLLVKKILRHHTPTGQATMDETYYSEFKTSDGVQYAGRARTTRNGRPLVELEVHDAFFKQTLPAAMFTRPRP